MSLLILAIITATPRTLPAALASARSGDTIRLAEGSYRDVRIDRTFSPAVTIEATDTIVRGLRIAGGGVLWRGGTVSAPAGRNGFAAAGYAALVTGQNVTFSGTTFTNAKKAMVLDRAKGVTVMDSSFLRNGEDGIIASRTARLTVLRSRFALTMAKASSCTTVDGIVYRIARRDCLAHAGVWADGYHPDAGMDRPPRPCRRRLRGGLCRLRTGVRRRHPPGEAGGQCDPSQGVGDPHDGVRAPCQAMMEMKSIASPDGCSSVSLWTVGSPLARR